MTWRPSSSSVRLRPSSSVSKARFVTAGAISMKLGVFAIRPILWPPGGHLENQTFAI
jgi:hypothetical protein